MEEVFWFPDNTVLCNFGIVDRLDLLRDVLRQRGRWTEAIADEVANSSAFIPALDSISKDGWLAEPIEIVDPELQKAVSITRRAVFDGTDEQPLKHLGEAQTCVLIRSSPKFKNSYWISDDKSALRYARHSGISTLETVDVVGMAVIEGGLSAEEGFELMLEMVQAGQHPRLPTTSADLLR